jgi:hypothetical protein
MGAPPKPASPDAGKHRSRKNRTVKNTLKVCESVIALS